MSLKRSTCSGQFLRKMGIMSKVLSWRAPFGHTAMTSTLRDHAGHQKISAFLIDLCKLSSEGELADEE